MSGFRIDLVSDTSSKPTAEMRQAMANADVGDEQRGEDPSVNALCDRIADLMGKEAALFLPSGTMCNLVAILVHCRHGDEIIAADGSHIIGAEGAGAAAFAGSFIKSLDAPRGIFTGADVEAAVRARRPKSPRSSLLEVEQTNNRGGGAVWPLDAIQEVAAAARKHDLAVHMDGARLLNAVVASGVSAADFSAPFDSAWLDLSKGLGCPFGGVLAGSKDFIGEAEIWKHRLGGAMRQGGVMAAAGIYALDNLVDRLADDHENAKTLANEIAEIPGLKLSRAPVETNLVFFDVSGTGLTAQQIHERLAEQDIRIGVDGPMEMRAVTHIDISAADITDALSALRSVVA